jgi:desampylase
MEITISRAIRDEILAYAAAEPKREVCGLMFGSVTCVEMVQPCANVSPCPTDSFEIDPAALIAAHKRARRGGPPLIGCYHSHPNGSAEPSARDAESADVNLPIWVIVARNTVTIWRYDGQKFLAK